MGLWELFILAVGLSMDAFAVSVCKGLCTPKVKAKHMLIAGLYFGGFQALMPLIGYALGIRFQKLITSVDHWIAFVLLSLIGINMIREAWKSAHEEEGCEVSAEKYDFRTMLPLAVATSIDALAVGVTFAFLDVEILPAVVFIGSITFVLSGIGVRIGSIAGSKLQTWAEAIGGAILILMGCKILLEHLGIL